MFLLGKQRRLQFVEGPNDVNGMIDAAKYADLALLLIDGSFGFEMVSSSEFWMRFLYELTIFRCPVNDGFESTVVAAVTFYSYSPRFTVLTTFYIIFE